MIDDAPPQTDFHIDQHAEVAHKLMVKLGYNQYGTDMNKMTDTQSAWLTRPT